MPASWTPASPVSMATLRGPSRAADAAAARSAPPARWRATPTRRRATPSRAADHDHGVHLASRGQLRRGAVERPVAGRAAREVHGHRIAGLRRQHRIGTRAVAAGAQQAERRARRPVHRLHQRDERRHAHVIGGAGAIAVPRLRRRPRPARSVQPRAPAPAPARAPRSRRPPDRRSPRRYRRPPGGTPRARAARRASPLRPRRQQKAPIRVGGAHGVADVHRDHRARRAPVRHVQPCAAAARSAPRSADTGRRDRRPTTPRRRRGAAPRRAWPTRGRAPAPRGWRPSPCRTSRCRAPRRARRRARPPRAALRSSGRARDTPADARGAAQTPRRRRRRSSIGTARASTTRRGRQRAVAKPRRAQRAGIARPRRCGRPCTRHGDVVAGAAAAQAGDVRDETAAAGGEPGGRRHGPHIIP